MNRWPRLGAVGTAGMATLILVSACQTSQSSSEPSASASAIESSGASASTPAGPVGEASIAAPPEVGAGEKFDVDWTGPNGQGDYITIVAAGSTEWTDEPYFYTTAGSPGHLVAPIQDGAYALWYVSGATETILTRVAIRVTPFEGALGGPAEVMAGSQFQVAWNGPNGPGDYVTIVATGATEWTDEWYFYTSAGSPGTLVAPIDPGAYELWYVPGSQKAPTATSPITVTAFEVTLNAPDSVNRGATFEVEWTGPDGPSDYITIVAAGASKWTDESYAYTAGGSPVTLTAPATAGAYEIWYASDRVDGTFASIDITVR